MEDMHAKVLARWPASSNQDERTASSPTAHTWCGGVAPLAPLALGHRQLAARRPLGAPKLALKAAVPAAAGGGGSGGGSSDIRPGVLAVQAAAAICCGLVIAVCCRLSSAICAGGVPASAR